MPDSFDPERIQRLIRAAYAVSTSPCPALYITFEATQTAANELVKKWKKNGNGAPNFQLTWEAHVALYINELETRLLTDKPSNPPLPLLFPLMGPSFQAPHHMLHHHTSTSTSSPKIRLSDLKTAPISFISEVFNPELKACVFEGCSGGKVINRGVNDQGARDVYGVFRDERSFAPKRFECTKCKRTFALGTAAMTSKVKLWEVPNNLNRFSSRSGVTSDLNDLICELRPYTLTGKIVRALRRESVSTLSDHKLRLMILLYGYPELHLLYSHRSHHTYLSYLATQPATLTFSNRAPQQFYSEAEVTLLERARDAEGKADPDAEDLEEEEEGRQEEGVRVEAGGGTLSGVERLQRGDVGEKEKAGGGRAKAFSPTKDIVNDVYTAFAQHQRIPENEQWTRTRSVKVLVIDTSFAYTNRAKITVAGTVDDKRKGAAPIPREIAFSGGVLSGLNEHSEGVVLRVMMSQTHKELEEVLESLAGRVKALEGTVLGVGYDKCCEIEQLSKRVFGTQCRSVMDKYHFYQRILATIVAGIRNSRYKEVSADLRAAIVKTPASKGKVAVTWSREEQLEKMEAVREKYRLAGNVWTTGPGSSETVWESQLAHVRKGCLSTQGSLKKLRSDESRVELWHHTLKGMQARVAGGIINMSLQIHDAFLRRNLRMGAKAGKHSRLNAFRLTSYGSHHLFLVNRINSLYNKVFRTSDKRPLFEDVDSGETFGLVANKVSIKTFYEGNVTSVDEEPDRELESNPALHYVPIVDKAPYEAPHLPSEVQPRFSSPSRSASPGSPAPVGVSLSPRSRRQHHEDQILIRAAATRQTTTCSEAATLTHKVPAPHPFFAQASTSNAAVVTGAIIASRETPLTGIASHFNVRGATRPGAPKPAPLRIDVSGFCTYVFLIPDLYLLWKTPSRSTTPEPHPTGSTSALTTPISNPSPPKVLRFSPSQIYILNIMCVDPRSTSRGLTSRDHYRFEKLFLEHGWRSDWKELELRKAANEYFDLDGGPHDKVRRDWKIIRDLCVKTEKNIRGWQRRKLEKDPTLTSYATPFLNLTIPPAAEAKSNVKVCLRCGVAVSGAGRGNNAHKKVYCSDGVRQIHINIPYPQPPQLFDSGVISAGEAKRLLRKLRGEGMVLDAQMERFIWMVAQFPRDISGQIRWEGFEMAGKTWEQTDWSRTDGVMTTEAQKTMVEPISQYIFRHLRD